MRRAYAILALALLVAPTVVAHEEDEGGGDDPVDPLHRYREAPGYGVLDDRWWFFGEATRHVPEAALPTNSYASRWEIAADGDWVVWIDQTRPGGDVYAYNLDARSGFYLTDDEAQQHNPSVRGRHVVWEDYRDGQAEIYRFDLERGSKAVRVTNNTAAQRNPVVGNGWIVYEDRSDFTTGTDLWIHSIAEGVDRPLVVLRGDQTAPTFAADHVVFRDDLFGQMDVMAVRIGGGVPFYLTRDVAPETAPVSSGGGFGFFLHAQDDAWRLFAFDGLRNRTRDTGYDFDAASRLAIRDGVVVYTTYHSGGNSFLSVANLNNGKYSRVSDNIPIRGSPLFAGERILTILGGDGGGLLLLAPSEFSVNHGPTMRIVGPPEGAPFTAPRFTANGTFRTNPVWGEPQRFEYRLGRGNWTAFDAAPGDWNVTVEVPRGLRVGQKVPFEVRAVFAAAPDARDTATIEYVVISLRDRVLEVAEPSLWERLQRAVGAIVLAFVAFVLLVLFVVRLVLRGTLRRLAQRRVKAEYIRPDRP